MVIPLSQVMGLKPNMRKPTLVGLVTDNSESIEYNKRRDPSSRWYWPDFPQEAQKPRRRARLGVGGKGRWGASRAAVWCC
jgi:hypothetical protein